MEPVARYQDVARLLDALASPTRLAILHQLRTPRLLAAIRVQPTVTRAGESAERPLARQTVAHHVEQLAGHGLLDRVPMPDGSGEGYVLHRASLFAVLDEVRRLAKLRSILAEDARATVAQPESSPIELPPAPRLVVAYGPDDGVAFALPELVGASLRIGRAAGAEIRLDHDPWISGEHAAIERTASGFVLSDLGSRNGTWLNWERLAPNRPAVLPPGALVTAGRTVLVFQP